MKLNTFFYILLIVFGVGGLSCAPSGEDSDVSITNQQHSTDFDHFKIESIQYKNDSTQMTVIYVVITFSENLKPGVIEDIKKLSQFEGFLSLPDYQSVAQSHFWCWVSSQPNVITGELHIDDDIGNPITIALSQVLENIKDDKGHPLLFNPNEIQTLSSAGIATYEQIISCPKR